MHRADRTAAALMRRRFCLNLMAAIRCRISGCLAALVLSGVAVATQAGQSAPGGPDTAQPLVVFAAASLRDVLNDMLAQWQLETGGRAVVSYAGTSALARQIERGAPADLFISADQAWMDYLLDRGAVVPDSVVQFARNALVLVVPAGSEAAGPAQIADSQLDLPALLGRDGRLAMANPAHVPAGRYGQQALRTLGLYDALKTRLTRSANVRLALTLVARSECPLGVVYASDAHAERRVRVLANFPADTHAPIVYPAALTSRGGRAGAARLLDWLVAPARVPVLSRFGFLEP